MANKECGCLACILYRTAMEHERKLSGDGTFNPQRVLEAFAACTASVAADIIGQMGRDVDPIGEMYTLAQAELVKRIRRDSIVLRDAAGVH